MRVVFEPAAQDDLVAIAEWIAKDNPRAAAELIDRIEAKVMRLTTPGLAHIGRPGLISGTRELIEHPYIIVYKADEGAGAVTVIAVVHGALRA